MPSVVLQTLLKQSAHDTTCRAMDGNQAEYLLLNKGCMSHDGCPTAVMLLPVQLPLFAPVWHICNKARLLQLSCSGPVEASV